MSVDSKPTSVPPLSEDYIVEAVRRGRKQIEKPGGGDCSRFARALLQVYERDRQWVRIVETEIARADAAERKLQDA